MWKNVGWRRMVCKFEQRRAKGYKCICNNSSDDLLSRRCVVEIYYCQPVMCKIDGDNKKHHQHKVKCSDPDKMQRSIFRPKQRCRVPGSCSLYPNTKGQAQTLITVLYQLFLEVLWLLRIIFEFVRSSKMASGSQRFWSELLSGLQCNPGKTGMGFLPLIRVSKGGDKDINKSLHGNPGLALFVAKSNYHT